MKHKLAIIGASAGGVDALKIVLDGLGNVMTTSIVVVIHYHGSIEKLIKIYSGSTKMIIKEAEEGENINEKGHIYFAPVGYHLSFESDFTFSLAIEERVNYVRPSVDVTMSAAAEVYTEDLTAIILTGANEDGAKGMKRVESLGGTCIVQSLDEAFMKMMPESTLKLLESPQIMTLKELNEYLKRGTDR